MANALLNKKIDHWEHQLLDLGKRNRMINYRETKRATLKLTEPSFEELYRRLVTNEETLTFQRSVDRETDTRTYAILSLLEAVGNPIPVSVGEIKTELSILERRKTLQQMRAKTRLAMEEQGINILYIAFGFIEWQDEKGASAQWIKSPLLLMPAVLTLDTLKSPYKLSRHEDDIVLNPTLSYYFKTEYGIELPHFDSEKNSLDEYFKELERIAKRNGWRILRETDLSLLSFLKITMYNDLIRNEERIRQNPVIRAMAGDGDEANHIPQELMEANPDSVKTQDCYQVVSADSSQQDAILYSKNKISFVMQGPPGTGKSQTITNIIAEALADGKKVLFVSEKMSALQVVYRRLQETRLADFCLPLHSYKANKSEILQQIGANLNLKQTHVRDSALQNLEELLDIRRELNQYAGELHELHEKLNLSCYDVYGKLEKLRDAPSLSFELSDILNITPTDLQRYLHAVTEYALSLEKVQDLLSDHPWEGLCVGAEGSHEPERMRIHLDIAQKHLSDLMEILKSISEIQDFSDAVSMKQISDLAEALSQIGRLPDFPLSWNNVPALSELKTEAEDAAELYRKMSDLKYDIALTFRDSVYGFDYNGWKKQLFSSASELTSLSLLKNKTAMDFILDSLPLTEAFRQIKQEFLHAEEALSAINLLFGLKLPLNAKTFKMLSEMLPLIRSNILLPTEWFKKNGQDIRNLICEGKEKAILLSEYRAAVLADWEPQALELDYAPIFNRYKTEYTGFSKNFKSQYKKDKKLLLSLTKEFLKKMPDEKAIAFLSLLKQYHEQDDWFRENNGRLLSLSFYGNGETSDWDGAERALATVMKLQNFSSSYHSDTLHRLLSRDHGEAVEKFSVLLGSLGQALDQIRKIAEQHKIAIRIESPSFNATKTVPVVGDYLSRLESLCAHGNLIRSHLNADASYETIFHVIDQLNEHKAISEKIEQRKPFYRKKFDFYFTDGSTDWNRITERVDQIQNIRNLPLYSLLKPLLGTSVYRRKEIDQCADSCKRIYDQAEKYFSWLSEQFSQTAFDPSLTSAAAKLARCLNNMDKLEPYADYLEASADCTKIGLADFMEKVTAPEHIKQADAIFLKRFYRLWLEAVCAKSASIRRFRKVTQDKKIETFIELDDLQLKIAQMRIREKLIESLPTHPQFLKATDEVSILNKELSKKRNIMPLRKLFRSIPNLLLKLKPCLMMSPLSVSYFLETEAYHFDLVIFDEASQIFPEDAIGAIFRGSQVIIAGDSKQLPPTNFFSVSMTAADTDTSEDDENYEDLISDSILEESAAALPNRTLRWHYRSKHESLIAFSNREIYQNNLITFPSPANHVEGMGVEYVYVKDGYYQSGGKNCNIKEAETCVKLVEEHIRKFPSRSLGIIAFSEKQQNAIENAIMDFRERNPQYESFFEEKEDAFFIKNLENVQGDERDTIIFSICYAKDQNGKMHMRFGPLSVAGGERRLNVAVTRAKCNIKLVGSILPSDLDLSKTKSEGVRMLRSYIEFAQQGTSALRPIKQRDENEVEDNFCQSIVAFLEKNGYRTQTQLGCSDYKVDIAVEHPDNQNIFLAAIECDGLSYYHAKTARDRDHLRKAVLENMGWKLYRVWSTEWNRNPDEEGEALLQFLKQAVENDSKDSAEAPMPVSEKEPLVDFPDEIATEYEKPAEPNENQTPYHFSYYREINPSELLTNLNKTNYFATQLNIQKIVTAEQPIHIDLLYKHLAATFEGKKLTESVKQAVDLVLKTKLKQKIGMDENRFLFSLPKQPIHARIPEKDMPPRAIEYIHPEEISEVLLTVLQHAFGITTDDLIGECAHILGFEKKWPKVKQKIQLILNELTESNAISVIDGKVSLSGACK